MRRVAIAAAAALFSICPAAFAQDPPPPLPRIVLDLHGLVPVFPNDAPQLAASRPVPGRASSPVLTVPELPGPGLGGNVGVHVYPFKIKRMTVGVGGEVMVGKSSSTPAEGTTDLVAVDERLRTFDGQLSLNFGTGHGWSYLSGGVGRSMWSVHPAGSPETAADTESLPTTNYGGGARWFAKKHLAFSLDVRIYEIQPGSTGSPRTRLFVVGAGISLK